MLAISSLTNTPHVKYIRQRNKESCLPNCRLSHTERKSLIREPGLGLHALVLFEYYLRLASTKDAVISDADAGEYFDWSPHTAKRHRLTLIKAGWMAVEKATLRNGRRVEVYYLGKEEVRASGIKPEAETPKKKAPAKPDMSLFELDSLK